MNLFEEIEKRDRIRRAALNAGMSPSELDKLMPYPLNTPPLGAQVSPQPVPAAYQSALNAGNAQAGVATNKPPGFDWPKEFPHWAVHHDFTSGRPSITPAGYLWLRLGRMARGNALQFMREINGALFSMPPDVHVMAVTETKEEAVVFVVKGDKPLILRDHINLFPSDGLLTALKTIGE